MSKALFLGRILTVAVIVAAILSTAAHATPYPPSMAGHSAPAVSQPFSSSGQSHLLDFGVGSRMK